MKNDFKNLLAYLIFNHQQDDNHLQGLLKNVDLNKFLLSFSVNDIYRTSSIKKEDNQSSDIGDTVYLYHFDEKFNSVPTIEKKELVLNSPNTGEENKALLNRIYLDFKTYVRLILKQDYDNLNKYINYPIEEEITIKIKDQSIIFNQKTIDFFIENKNSLVTFIAIISQNNYVPYSAIFHLLDKFKFLDDTQPNFNQFSKCFINSKDLRLSAIYSVFTNKNSFNLNQDDLTKIDPLTLFGGSIPAKLVNNQLLQELTPLFEKKINDNTYSQTNGLIYNSIFYLIEAGKPEAINWSRFILKSNKKKEFLSFIFNLINDKKLNKNATFDLIWDGLNKKEKENYLSMFNENNKTHLLKLVIDFALPKNNHHKDLSKI